MDSRNQIDGCRDGEVVVPAADGTTDFSVLQNELKGRSTSIVLVAFDLLYLNGRDLRKLPLFQRKTELKKIIDRTEIQFSESFEIEGREVFELACKIGLEGVVSKVRDSAYASGRGDNWSRRPARSGRPWRSPVSRSTKENGTESTSAARKSR